MSFGLPSLHVTQISRLVVQKIDWRYFQMCAVVSAMYLFNVFASALVLSGRVVLQETPIIRLMTNFPFLTLIYLVALVELLDLKLLASGITKYLQNRSKHPVGEKLLA